MKAGVVGAFLVFGIIGFAVWGMFFYEPAQDQPAAADSKTSILVLSGASFDTGAIETEMHRLVNAERAKMGLSPLAYDSELAAIAADHSSMMNSLGFFDHVNPSGQDPIDRARAVDYNCLVGENIKLFNGIGGYNDLTLAKTTIQDWMNSPEHRANMLDERYRSDGFGVSIEGSQAYVTQMLSFC